MSKQPNQQSKVIARRIQLTRRPRRREVLPDTTVTETWPPRLNTAM